MKEELLDEILDAIVPSLEAAEAQTAALFQLLREKNVITADEYERVVDQASNASDIKARATRLRLKRVLTSALKELEEPKEKPAEQQKAQQKAEGPEPDAKTEQKKYGKEPEKKPDSAPPEQGATKPGEKQETAPESSETISAIPEKKAS